METIFKKPLVLNGEKDNLILVYSKYIIANIKSEIVDLSVEVIDKGIIKTSRFETIIKIKEIFAYKFKPGSDSHIVFGVRNVTGTHYVNIDFKDAETTKQAEILFKEKFEKLGFKRREKQIKPFIAAIFPLTFALIIAIVGLLLAWFAYEVKDYELTQLKIVNQYLYLSESVLKKIGYFPLIVMTILLLVICLICVYRKIANPLYEIRSAKF